MQHYRKSTHCVYDIKYHIVWITKYRKPVLTGKIAKRTKELINQICQKNEVEIISGTISNDHIHILISVPPQLPTCKLVKYIKAYSSKKLQLEYKELHEIFCGRYLWSKGYFIASSGNVTDESITEYVQSQDTTENNKINDFKILDV